MKSILAMSVAATLIAGCASGSERGVFTSDAPTLGTSSSRESQFSSNALGSAGYQTVGGIEHRALATSIGTRYMVTFMMSGNGFCPPTVKTLKISAAGQSTTLTWDTSGGNDAQHGVYAQRSWSVPAKGLRTTLTFASLDPRKSGCGPIVGAFSAAESSSGGAR
jgi:hypothetical protein